MAVDPVKVEKLKVWYALFTTILDSSEYAAEIKLEKLTKLRELLDLDLKITLN